MEDIRKGGNIVTGIILSTKQIAESSQPEDLILQMVESATGLAFINNKISETSRSKIEWEDLRKRNMSLAEENLTKDFIIEELNNDIIEKKKEIAELR